MNVLQRRSFLENVVVEVLLELKSVWSFIDVLLIRSAPKTLVRASLVKLSFGLRY
jgi:hypothetical protein